MSDCIDQLKPLASHDVKSVEALILQSACYAGLADQRKLESVLLRSRSDERLKTALKLAPHNPRAVFLSSMEGLARAKPGSDEQRRSFAELERAAQLFDAVLGHEHRHARLGTRRGVPGLGRQLQSRGDQVGARNWIEKSLIAAPDYKAAQRQLAQLVRH